MAGICGVVIFSGVLIVLPVSLSGFPVLCAFVFSVLLYS